MSKWLLRNVPLIGLLSPEREIPLTGSTKEDWQDWLRDWLDEALEPVAETVKDISDFKKDVMD